MLPDIGAWHPVIVHFVVALLVVGVLFRWASLTGKAAFTGPAAATLLVTGTLAAILAVESGVDAHGPVERVPGARDAVEEHEEWGERARNVFIVIAGLEVLALVIGSEKNRRRLLVGSAVLGLAGLATVYEAGEHGGDLVYSYAGGVGTASGDTADLQRLLVAGLYQQSRADRAAGQSADAARLVDEMRRRRPGDSAVRLLEVESLIRDRRDGAAALAVLDAMQDQAEAGPRRRLQVGLYRAEAQVLAGSREDARTTLEALAREFPDDQRVTDRLAELR